MEIKLKTLQLINFKGIKSLTVDLDDKLTNIYGANATGKTTLFDAWNWLLFNKDSFDRQNFEIKTLDKNNEPIKKLTHSVEGILSVDGMKKVFKKEYREKWQKKRGEAEEQFTGHETDHFMDGIPVSKKDYEYAVSGLINESIFKLISNPFYFANQKWEYKRKMVTDIVGEPTVEEVAKGSKDFQALIDMLEGKTIEELLLKVKHEAKSIKKDMQDIPSRIDELLLNIHEEQDTDRIKSEIDLIDKEIESISQKIQDRQKHLSSKHDAYSNLSTQYHTLKSEIEDKKRKLYYEQKDAHGRAIDDLKTVLNVLRTEKEKEDRNRQKILSTRERIDWLTDQKNKLLEEYKKEAAKTFEIKEGDTKCYACGQELPDAENLLEERKEAFLKEQKETLNFIKTKGIEVKVEIAELNALTDSIQELFTEEDYEQQISKKEQQIKTASESEIIVDYSSLKGKEKELADLKVRMEAASNSPVDNSDLKEKIALLDSDKDKLQEQLTMQQERLRILDRVSDLEKLERKYADELAKKERLIFIAEKYQKKKMEIMDKSIKAKFGDVQFKMYKQLINGGEEPTCEILIDGVPFDNANRAAQINTGIKIINALNAHYGYSAPIFVDNAEAVNEITETGSQLIRLVVVDPQMPNEGKEKYLERELVYKANGILLKPLK